MTDTEIDALEIDLALYDKGRQLRVIVNTPAWETVVQTLEDYRDAAKDDLIALAPGDTTVPTAHAAAAALDTLVAHFKQDIAKAIDAAANPSDEVKEFLFGAREHLDVAKAMEQQG